MGRRATLRQARERVRALGRLLVAGAIMAGLSLNAPRDAHATITATVGFTPDVISPHLASTLRIVLSNTDAEDATALTLTQSLPAGVVVAPLPNLSNTCGGAVAIVPGGTTLMLTAGVIP